MKTVVVTGVAGGIGAAVAADLLRQGLAVVGADLPKHCPDLAVDSSYQKNFTYFPTDVSDEASVAALARAVRSSGSTVQGLVACAGVVLNKPLLETSLAEWRYLHAVNADGVFLTVREIAAVMVEQEEEDPDNQRGIVVVASNAASTPRVEFGAYGASKASALSMASSFGLQLAAHGIRVNTVCPGTTRTPMVIGDWAGQDLSAAAVRGTPENFRLGIPLGRIAEPEDISSVISFLLSPEARHMSMQSLTVDGGATF